MSQDPTRAPIPSAGDPVFDGTDARRAVTWFFVFVVAGGLLLGEVFQRTTEAEPPARRNPHFLRLWPEHVQSAAPRRPDERLVVIVSNSQGYGHEVGDADTYASLLEPALAERTGDPVRVLNWSVPGGRGPEFVLLAAAAALLNADDLILLSGPSNFSCSYRDREGAPTRLDSFTSDIRHLVAYGDIRARLPQSFAGHFIRWTDFASAGLARATRVWAYRDLLLARLAGIPAVRSFEKSGDANAWGVDDPRVLDFRGPHDSVCVSWQLFDEYVEAASAGPGRKVFVFMPLQPGRRVLYPEFARLAGERLDGTGLDFWDLSWTLPPQRFLTPTHLDETGHRLLARILLEKLTR